MNLIGTPFENTAVQTTTETQDATVENPPTEKQLNFLQTLASERDVKLEDMVAGLTLDKQLASKLIDALLKMPKVTKAAPAKEAAAPVENLEGFHAVEEEDGEVTIFKVQKSQTTGKPYCKVLLRGGGWMYVGRVPLRRLSEDTRLTLEKAKEYGHLYGVCCRCGATLTDEGSIAAGIGPVCATRGF